MRGLVRSKSGVLAVVVMMLSFVGCSGAGDSSASAASESYYVALQGSSAVETLPVAELVPDLPSAHYVAVSADASHLLVSSAKTPYAFLVNAGTGEVLGKFDVGDFPQGVAISPDGKTGVAVGSADGTLTFIDIDKADAMAVLGVGREPHNARFTDDGKRIYVTLQGEGKVAVIDAGKQRVIEKIAVPGIDYPHNLDLSADEKILWIRGFAGKVAAVDLASKKVLAVIAVGPSHAGIDVIPGSHYVATAAIGGNQVDIIDATRYQVVKQIDVGPGSHGIRSSADGRWLYVGVTSTNEVRIIDTSTWDIVNTVEVQGKTPFWIDVPGND